MTYISDDEMVVWTNDEGTVRIRAQRDNDYSSTPENDGEMITLQVESEHQDIVRGEYALRTGAYAKGNPHFDDIYRQFDMRWYLGYRISTDDVFERYLRIFHGTRTFYTYGPTPYTTDYKYITFDTAEWRKIHGLTDEHMAKHPDIDFSARTDFSEYRHYLEGNSYGLILEHKVLVEVDKRDYVTAEWTRGERYDEWEEKESVWGFYTDKEEDLREWGLDTFGLTETPASA